MRISEFCKTFQVSHQAVYAKIKKYAAELEGHISKNKGNVTDLDPFAFAQISVMNVVLGGLVL